MSANAATDNAPLDGETVKIGLLMEAAQAQQRLAETHLERMRVHLQELDEVVRSEIRRTLIEELAQLTAEMQQAAQSLRAVKRQASLRLLLWGGVLMTMGCALPPVILEHLLPSPGEMLALRAERERLRADIKSLEQRGGDVPWKRCGDARRLCVRIDRHSPAFGEHADYFVLAEH